MTPTLWQKFVPHFATPPSVNQVEFNPYFQQKEIRELMAKDNVKLEAWAPLGQGNKTLFAEPVLVALTEKYQKDVEQIILRSQIQEGIITLPRSVNPARIQSNVNIFDFSLTEEEINQIRTLDKGQGIHNPDADGVAEFLLANYVIED